MTTESENKKKKAVRDLLDGVGCQPAVERWKKEPTLDKMVEASNSEA